MHRDLLSWSFLPLAAFALAWGCVVEETPTKERFGAGGGANSSGEGGSFVAAGGGATVSSATTGGAGPSSSSMSSSSSGTPCDDPGSEPNESEGDAIDLGEFDDCDGNGGQLIGALSPGDEDWFKYIGGDAVLCDTNPGRTLDADGTVQICKFFEGFANCDDLSYECPGTTTASESPAGVPGCCGTQDFSLDLSCGAIPGTAKVTVYMRLTSPPSESCVSYSLAYHY